MNRFETLIQDVDKANLEFIVAEFEPVLKIVENFNNYVKTLQNVVHHYKDTKTIADLDYRDWEALAKNGTKLPTSLQNGAKSRNESKENVEPTTTPPSTRPRRNAFKEATQNINQQSSMSINKKLRRPDTQNVKSEKLSICNNVTIKTETDEMPAPKKPAPKKKPKLKIEVKLEKLDEKITSSEKPIKAPFRKDSDVIVQDVHISTIELTDSDEDAQIKEKPVRQTRTKTKVKIETERKRMRPVESSDTDSKDDSVPKRSKSETSTEAETSNHSKYDDAVSTIIDDNVAQNATFVSVASNQPLNTTVVVDKPKTVNIPALEDLMTDDDTPPPKPAKKAIPKPISKQVFSPYENSPVKKKVAAFERLKDEAAAPPRVTRTKTRAQAKEQSEPEDSTTTSAQPKPATEKSNIATPLQSRFLPKSCSTTRTSKTIPHSASDSLITTKALSALKASQAEYQKREKKRKEKEEEAFKKREALMHSQMEEKKRKREEKQLKAQHQREVLEEMEMAKTLEVQRLKEERHKQLMAEQEERKHKLREEMEKKRKLIKVKAAQEKKKEEEKRVGEQRQIADLDKREVKMMQERKVPVYMRTRAPMLPTDDCYDSDDENYSEEKIKVASWATGAALKKGQLCMLAAGETIKNTFFSRLAVTPDLTDIFEVIDQSKLKRSSSAIWRRPPRYTMMPDLHLESFVEDDE